MSDRLMISTRKGAFFFNRSAGGWELAETAFLGSPVVNMLKDGRDGTVYASLNLGHFGPKLHRSEDDGKSWDEITMPAFPNQGEEGGKGPSVAQLWVLTEADRDQPGTLWAGTVGGGLFHSADRGDSWTLNNGLFPKIENWFGGGNDAPGIHSVCVDPRDPARLAIAISVGGVWLSEDGGETWQGRTSGMRADYMPPEKADETDAQDPHRMVQNPADPNVFWVQHHCGIFQSGDGLQSWRRITPETCPGFGFAVGVHPQDPDTAWFVPAVKDEYRYPQDGRFVVSRTRDGGATFELLDGGLPAEPAYDLVYRHGLDVNEDGTRLVIGSTTGGAWVSENGGDSWTSLPARLPPVYAVSFA